jgi:tyrosyl-tRNA synthetase
MKEVEEYGRLEGADIRKAKEVLAFEASKIVHGEEEAKKARDASKTLFIFPKGIESGVEFGTPTITVQDSIPTTLIDEERFNKGIPAFKLFEIASLCASSSEARRLIEQGGAYINNKRIDKFDTIVELGDFDQDGMVLLRAGKKKFHRIKILDKR